MPAITDEPHEYRGVAYTIDIGAAGRRLMRWTWKAGERTGTGTSPSIDEARRAAVRNAEKAIDER